MNSLKLPLTEQKIIELSNIKEEPNCIKTLRLKSLEEFLESTNAIFGPDIKLNFNKLNYNDEIIRFVNDDNDLKSKKVIHCDITTSLNLHQELFLKHFNNLIKYNENRYTTLNTAIYNNGSFIYIPKNTKLEKPLNNYIKNNQFERTIIIVDEGSEIEYIEHSLNEDIIHSNIVEIYVNKKSKCKYITIQNNSKNTHEISLKRAYVENDATMDWVNINLGSKINMCYPTSILKGDKAKSTSNSFSISNKLQTQDTGAKMIHIGRKTTSVINSTMMSLNGGSGSVRINANIKKEAHDSESNIKVKVLLLDNDSKCDVVPKNKTENELSNIKQETLVIKQSKKEAIADIVKGISDILSSECKEIILPLLKDLK